MPRQPVKVHIFNQTYTLLAEGDPAEVQELAHQIDELMSSIAGKTSSGESTRVAVMACLHLADELRTARRKLDAMGSKSEQIALLLEEALGA